MTTQASSSQPVDPTCRAMSAETMNTPEPIIDPATIIVESTKPKPRTNVASAPRPCVCAVSDIRLIRASGEQLYKKLNQPDSHTRDARFVIQ